MIILQRKNNYEYIIINGTKKTSTQEMYRDFIYIILYKHSTILGQGEWYLNDNN